MHHKDITDEQITLGLVKTIGLFIAIAIIGATVVGVVAS